MWKEQMDYRTLLGRRSHSTQSGCALDKWGELYTRNIRVFLTKPLYQNLKCIQEVILHTVALRN